MYTIVTFPGVDSYMHVLSAGSLSLRELSEKYHSPRLSGVMV